MTVQDAIDWLRNKLRSWLELPEMQDQLDMIEKLERSDDEQIRLLKGRIEELESAYAVDPRRAEIAKEKADKLNVVPGFTPRSKRIATWEGQRRAEPKK